MAMSARADLSEARRSRVALIAERASARAVSTWRRADAEALDASWAALAPAITRTALDAQMVAVAGANRHVGRLAAFDDVGDATPIQTAGMVGVDGSGRALDGLLHGTVTTTKERVAAGVGVVSAFESGAAYLAAMMQTAIMDVARQADMSAGVARKYDYYVRVVQPGACSRCLQLAGVVGMSDFKRHPACKCSVEPMTRDAYEDFNPFATQTDEHLRRALGDAGYEAWQAGGDFNQIVSSRRGALVDGMRSATGRAPRGVLRREVVGRAADGSPITVFTTLEGATRRGVYGRMERNLYRSNWGGAGTAARRRLMPESIFQIARDPAEARVLLIDAGYISPTRAFAGFPGPDYQASALANRAAADRIFRRAGITIQR